jgi:hypothetical protein
MKTLLTVGELRRVLSDLPADTPITIGDAPRPHGGPVNVALIWKDHDGLLVLDPAVVEKDLPEVWWRAEEARS